VAGRKFLALPYYSQRAVFASPLSAFYRPVKNHLGGAFHVQPVGVAMGVVGSSAVWRLRARHDGRHVFTLRVERVQFAETRLGRRAPQVFVVETKTRHDVT